MPVLNSIAAMEEEMAGWRRHLHAHPEIGFDCHATAAFVVDRLRAFGITRIETGIATSGVVALIDGREAGPTIGLRADMDALPLQETTGAPHASTVDGRMHACGHDGHTTMLLGAAKYLTETRNFAGRVALIFQPAEEDGGGGGVMVDEGILDRYDIAEVYALHNAPGTPIGEFYTLPGPIMAAEDSFSITVTGAGGHAAAPHQTADPVVAACAIVQGLQTIVSRNNNPVQDLVVSVTQIHTGTAENIVPETAWINGTVRTFDADLRTRVEARMGAVVAGHGAAYGVDATLTYTRQYPATVNDAEKTAFAVSVAAEIGPTNPEFGKEMGAEDFAFMLEKRPGAYLFVGNGETADLHNPNYDFSDGAAPYGASFFARLVERALPL